MEYSALIVAAGSGTRMQLGYNKVYYPFPDGRTILEHTMAAFLQDEDCRQVVVVTDIDEYRRRISSRSIGRIVLVQGGATRQESVCHGLEAVLCDHVMVHDGARPYLDQDCLSRIKEALQSEDAVCLMVPVKDTIKQVQNGYVAATLERSTLMAAQTPQAFRTQLLLDAMKAAEHEGFTGTDDCSLVERYGHARVKAVLGSYANLKITTPEDLR